MFQQNSGERKAHFKFWMTTQEREEECIGRKVTFLHYFAQHAQIIEIRLLRIVKVLMVMANVKNTISLDA